MKRLFYIIPLLFLMTTMVEAKAAKWPGNKSYSIVRVVNQEGKYIRVLVGPASLVPSGSGTQQNVAENCHGDINLSDVVPSVCAADRICIVTTLIKVEYENGNEEDVGGTGQPPAPSVNYGAVHIDSETGKVVSTMTVTGNGLSGNATKYKIFFRVYCCPSTPPPNCEDCTLLSDGPLEVDICR